MRRQPGSIYATQLRTYQQTINMLAEKKPVKRKTTATMAKLPARKVDAMNVNVFIGCG